MFCEWSLGLAACNVCTATILLRLWVEWIFS